MSDTILSILSPEAQARIEAAETEATPAFRNLLHSVVCEVEQVSPEDLARFGEGATQGLIALKAMRDGLDKGLPLWAIFEQQIPEAAGVN
jgi:hypothetical protein